MDNLNKIGRMISDHKQITQEIEKLDYRKEHVVSLYTDIMDIYKSTLYGEQVTLGEISGLVQDITKLQKLSNEDLSRYDDNLLIPASQFRGVDLPSCTLSFMDGIEPEPWETWDNDVVYVTIAGYVPWSDKQQKEECIKINEQLRELNNDLFELETQMKGMSLL